MIRFGTPGEVLISFRFAVGTFVASNTLCPIECLLPALSVRSSLSARSVAFVLSALFLVASLQRSIYSFIQTHAGIQVYAVNARDVREPSQDSPVVT